MGDPGCLSLFGKDAREHQRFAAHLTAEYATQVAAKSGEMVSQWKAKPAEENHYLDTVRGCAVGAAMCGCRLPGMVTPATVKRRVDMSPATRKSYAEYLKSKRSA
jgi:hypothetical protein